MLWLNKKNSPVTSTSLLASHRYLPEVVFYFHVKGTLMQIWKLPWYIFVLKKKRYPKSFAFLILVSFVRLINDWSSQCLSFRLRTKWLWVRIPLLSLKLHISCLFRAKSSLTFRQTNECGFILKHVCDMIIAYSQMHRTDKCSPHSSIIWPVWLNGLAFLCELSGCWFESLSCHLCLLIQKFLKYIKKSNNFW